MDGAQFKHLGLGLGATKRNGEQLGLSVVIATNKVMVIW